MTYEECLVEVDEILNYLVLEDLNKIPHEIRDAIHRFKDEQYMWKYDATKKLNEQKINKKTVAMLSYLNMEYMQTEEQKMLMKEYHKLNERRKMSQMSNSNYDNIFKDRKIVTEKDYEERASALVEVSEEKWYEKIFKYIKNIFRK